MVLEPAFTLQSAMCVRKIGFTTLVLETIDTKKPLEKNVPFYVTFSKATLVIEV